MEEEEIDEQAVQQELRKNSGHIKKKTSFEVTKSVTMGVAEKDPVEEDTPWYLRRFSEYPKILHMIAWMSRFITNCKKIHVTYSQELSTKEIGAAELLLCKLAQKESFKGENDPRLQGLNVFKENEFIRTRTIISNRQDNFCFRCPIVLHPEHLLTKRIVRHIHLKLNHAGIGIVMNNLREKFWIPQCRRLVQSYRGDL